MSRCTGSPCALYRLSLYHDGPLVQRVLFVNSFIRQIPAGPMGDRIDGVHLTAVERGQLFNKAQQLTGSGFKADGLPD